MVGLAKTQQYLLLISAHLCLLIREKDFLVLGQGPNQGLDYTGVTTEAEYSSNFTEQVKK